MSVYIDMHLIPGCPAVVSHRIVWGEKNVHVKCKWVETDAENSIVIWNVDIGQLLVGCSHAHTQPLTRRFSTTSDVYKCMICARSTGKNPLHKREKRTKGRETSRGKNIIKYEQSLGTVVRLLDVCVNTTEHQTHSLDCSVFFIHRSTDYSVWAHARRFLNWIIRAFSHRSKKVINLNRNSVHVLGEVKHFFFLETSFVFPVHSRLRLSSVILFFDFFIIIIMFVVDGGWRFIYCFLYIHANTHTRTARNYSLIFWPNRTLMFGIFFFLSSLFTLLLW